MTNVFLRSLYIYRSLSLSLSLFVYRYVLHALINLVTVSVDARSPRAIDGASSTEPRRSTTIVLKLKYTRIYD